MKRIAFFGPVNPVPSGISDYDEELLPLLRRHYEIDVFVDRQGSGENVHPHGQFYYLQKARPYDLCLYQMGNSLLHEYMYGYLFQYPGAIVFHDYCLHHSRAKMLFLKGYFDEYLAEVKAAHPERPEVGEVVYSGIAADQLFYFYPFVRLLLQSALVAGAHTGTVCEQLRVTETPVVRIPMGVNAPVFTPQEKAEIAALYPGKLVLASFGLATPEKRISTVLRALAELRCYYGNLRYIIVGQVASYYDLAQEIARWGLQEIVDVTGHVDRRRFDLLMARSDIVVNLRYPSAGEMSATLLRALALGKPVLMSRLLHLLEIPEKAAIRIRPDAELDDLFHHLWQLIEDANLRDHRGQAARSYAQTNHSPEQTLDKYREMIELGLERRSSFVRPDLPVHLQDGRTIMRDYIRRSAFAGKQTDLLDLIL
jgi:glycosyltransferase involved in cell wall biosynthesis